MVDEMDREERGHERRRVAFAVAVVLVLAAYNNVVLTQLPGYPASYVPANVTAAVLLLAAARASGLSRDDLGLDPRRLLSGARWGGACLALVAVGYAAALALPLTRPLLADARVVGLDAGDIACGVLVRIPLGTVLWEEVAFRGVLLAALARVLPLRAAVAISAAVFGVWHVRPTLSAIAVNDLAEGPVLVGLALLSGCLVTGLAGLILIWVRLRSGSLLAPILLHVATNSLGTLGAVVAVRDG